jgi:hypothetical protein
MELNAATRLVASQTEQELWEKLKKNGHATFTGKRAFDVIERLEKDGKLKDYNVHRDVYNANGSDFKSQHSNPKSRTAYEISVTKK